MNPNVCEEKHKNIDEKFETHERRLNNHAQRIDDLEKNEAAMGEKISGLIDKLVTLNSTLRWFIGLMVGAFVGFFFYVIQTNIFK